MSERLWDVLCESFPLILKYGIKVTLPLTAVSFFLALIIAVAVALIQYAKVKVLSRLCRFYIWITRGTPVVVQLFLVFYGLPKVGIRIEALPAAILVFGLNEGAYMAETIRAALETVPKEQLQAGYLEGISFLTVMRRIVIPQAARSAVPSLMNSLIGLLKETSLAACITVKEMFREAQVLNGLVYEPMALYCETAVIYLIFCTALTFLQKYLEKKLK